jgi:alpha-beta hydrolase superfamily lysophospholipase
MNNEVDPKTISKDATEVNKYIADPLVHNKISPMFSFPVIDAGEWAINNAQKLSVPMLIIHGTEDHLIDHNGSVAFAEKSTIAKLVLFEGGYHELHNDKERYEVMDTLSKWIKTKL